MLDIEIILTDPQHQSSRWKDLVRAKKKRQRFLILLAPLFEYTFKRLTEALEHSYPQVKQRCAPQFLFRSVKNDLSALLLPMIVRVCVLEMHSLSERKILKSKTSSARFNEFIQILTHPHHAAELLQKYTILKTQLSIKIAQYIDAYLEFFSRLNQDIETVYKTFLNGQYRFKLKRVKADGDRHNHGRCVMTLEFSLGNRTKKLIYKPRSVEIEVAYQAMLVWFNQHLRTMNLKTLTVAPKKNYGWVEFIDYRGCQKNTEIQRFYERMGILMGILYLLAGTDIHSENVIAHGEQPVVIDLECLFTPFYLKEEISGASAGDKRPNKAPERFTVLNTLFLPQRTLADENYGGFETSPLAAQGGEKTPYHVMEWKKEGTDQMHLVRVKKRMPKNANLPTLRGKRLQPEKYEKNVLSGFNRIYQIIMKNKRFFLSPRSPLMAFKHHETRVLLRSTSEYAKLLIESYYPLFLFDPQKRDEHFSWLIKKYGGKLNAVVRSELKSIKTENIPLFKSQTDGKFITDESGKKLEIEVVLSGFERVMYHIQHDINTKDFALQQLLIRKAYETLHLNSRKEKKISWAFKPRENVRDYRTRAIKIAKHSLDQLAQREVFNRNQISWPTLESVGPFSWNAGFTSINLYSGIAGIGLTFAYAAEIFHHRKYKDLAYQCFMSIHDTLNEQGIASVDGVGGFSGVGGLIYAFSHFYRLSTADFVLSDLEKLLNFVPKLLSDDNQHDLMGGCTGCLAAIQAAAPWVDETIVNEVSHQCIQHLLQNYPEPNQFPHENTGIKSSKPLLGFSHGVAGMAWALARANETVGNTSPRVHEWIVRALEYESQQFSHTQKNWPDFRALSKNKKEFQWAWCHGAPGIALSRLDLPVIYQNQTTTQVELAIESTLKKGFGGVHCLCHGSFGNLELLLTAVEKGLYPQQKYEQVAAALIHHIDHKGIQPGVATTYSIPGLMLGISGVIYQLMRVVYPGRVPNVLLFL